MLACWYWISSRARTNKPPISVPSRPNGRRPQRTIARQSPHKLYFECAGRQFDFIDIR